MNITSFSLKVDKMRQKLKRSIKEKLGAALGIFTLIFSVLGVFSLQEYITIFGSFAVLMVMVGMYKYA